MDRQKARWLRELLCGVLIGAGGILPGVSGGVLAVVFDVYRPVMETLSHPLRGMRRYWRMFVPLALGCAVGFLGLARVISAAYSHAAAAAVWLFLGLIAGTFPALWREAGRQGRGRGAYISCAVCAGAVFAALFYIRHVLRITVTPSLLWYNLCGALWGASVVIPGLTSSSIMMALGLYEPMLQGLAALRFDVLAACLPGFFITVAALSRSVTWMLERHYAVMFHGIVGVVAASSAVIVPLSYAGWWEVLLSVLCGVGGFFLALGLERLDSRPER